jgi:hypothetical protein
MFCLHCATPIDPSQRFCPTCGKPAPAQAPPVAPPPVAPPPLPQYSMPMPLGVKPERPGNVTLAAVLLFISTAISFSSSVYSVVRYGSRLFASPTYLLTPVFLILWVVFTIAVLQRQNWARIGIAILTVWGAMIIVTTIRILSRGRFNLELFAFPWVAFLIRVIASYLLFTPESNTWFKR